MESDDITALPPFAQGVVAEMKQAIRQKWTEAATTYFVRAVINKDVAIACGEAGFIDAMVFHRNKTAWLLAQALGCLAKSAEVETCDARSR